MRLLLTALFAAGLLSGCVGYSNWPPVEGADLASDNPNTPYSTEITTDAVAWVLQRYPTPGGQFAINLPAGTRRSTYLRIAEKLGGTPVTAEWVQANKPVYHVNRVWVRGGRATVDVLRPMSEIPPRTDGRPVYQCVTVHMEGRFEPWRVVRTQTREPGLIEPGEPWFLPEVEYPEHEQKIDRARQAEQRVVAPPAPAAPAEPKAEPTGEPAGAPE